VSAAEYFLSGDLEALRRDGSVTTRWTTAEEAARWRAVMRRVCRAAGLRVRTGASQGQAGMVAWAVHPDHVVTAAQAEAASQVIEAALDGEPQPAPFHVLARQAQREMLRLVPPEAGRTG
jgi:hypothetical protein